MALPGSRICCGWARAGSWEHGAVQCLCTCTCTRPAAGGNVVTDIQQPLTASVVGAGAGGRLSMQALARSDRFRLVAAADLRPDALASLAADYPGLRTFTDHHAMFDACPTDVVCVSTYPP